MHVVVDRHRHCTNGGEQRTRLNRVARQSLVGKQRKVKHVKMINKKHDTNLYTLSYHVISHRPHPAHLCTNAGAERLNAVPPPLNHYNPTPCTATHASLHESRLPFLTFFLVTLVCANDCAQYITRRFLLNQYIDIIITI